MVRTRKRNYGQLTAEKFDEDQKKKMAKKESVHRLPTETWLQVIAWIARMELAQRVSLVCSYFWALVHVRLHQRSSLFGPAGNNTRWMRSLQIGCEMVGRKRRAKDKQQYAAVMKRGLNWNGIEWAEGPMPNNIVGMEKIILSFFDVKVFAFFARIRPLLVTDLHLNVYSLTPENSLAMEHILPLCTGPILSVYLENTAIVEFPSKFPLHWAKCQLVHVDFTNLDHFRKGMLKLLDWLTVCNGNGGPKLLRIVCSAAVVVSSNEFIDQVKQHFIASVHPTAFLVRMDRLNVTEFCEINGRSSEQLLLAKMNDDEMLLSRCPIGGADRSEMAKAREKMRNWIRQMGVLNFSVHKIGNLEGIKNE